MHGHYDFNVILFDDYCKFIFDPSGIFILVVVSLLQPSWSEDKSSSRGRRWCDPNKTYSIGPMPRPIPFNSFYFQLNKYCFNWACFAYCSLFLFQTANWYWACGPIYHTNASHQCASSCGLRSRLHLWPNSSWTWIVNFSNTSHRSSLIIATQP